MRRIIIDISLRLDKMPGVNAIQAKQAALSEQRVVLIQQRAALDAQITKIDAQNEVLAELLDVASTTLNGDHAAGLLERVPLLLGDAVLEVLPAFQGAFTKTNLGTAVSNAYPALKFSEKSLDKPLKNLIDEGVVLVERKGGARHPSVFRVSPSKPTK